MVIYSDTLIHLDFDPKTDILKVKWPHLVDEPMLIVHPLINKIIDSIRYFIVSNLLIDTKDTNTNIPEEDFRMLSREFVAALSFANVKKLARIIYAEPKREIRARILMEELSAKLGSGYKSRDFTDEKSALVWLQSDGI